MIDVPAIIGRIRRRHIPFHVLYKLGLSRDWLEKVPPEFVVRVAKIADERRRLLEDLARR